MHGVTNIKKEINIACSENIRSTLIHCKCKMYCLMLQRPLCVTAFEYIKIASLYIFPNHHSVTSPSLYATNCLMNESLN